MVVRVPYTHGYDRVLTILRIVTGLIWIGIVLLVLSAAGQIFEILHIDFSWFDSLPGWLTGLLEIVFFLGALALAIYLQTITTNRWISILSAYLYIRIRLRTKISLRDADYLSWLFVPNETGSWYPMREVLQIPREIRRQYLLNKAAEIYRAVETKKQILAK